MKGILIAALAAVSITAHAAGDWRYVESKSPYFYQGGHDFTFEGCSAWVYSSPSFDGAYCGEEDYDRGRCNSPKHMPDFKVRINKEQVHTFDPDSDSLGTPYYRQDEKEDSGWLSGLSASSRKKVGGSNPLTATNSLA